jgi:predicted nucleic acid-binding protein
VILADAGPLVAILNKGDQHHVLCTQVLPKLRGPLVTTWPAFTEAMHFLGAWSSWTAQRGLWAWVNRGTLVIEDITPSMVVRMQTLMQQYRDRPMDLADASLVALAESLKLSTIFTVDSDFRIYRLPNGGTFEVIP